MPERPFRDVVERMSPEQVRYWIRRLMPNHPSLPENRPDNRSPIARLIDDAVGREDIARALEARKEDDRG